MDYDDNDYDYPKQNNVVLIYNSYDEKGKRTARIERKIWGDDCEGLITLLTQMTYFLQAMTFTYVDGLVATKNGEDVAVSE
jgi:hypothetical protein